MWLEGEFQEQDRKMLQNKDKKEGKGLVPWVVGGGTAAVPGEGSPCPEQQGGEGTTVVNWQRFAAWTLPPVQEKTLQKPSKSVMHISVF